MRLEARSGALISILICAAMGPASAMEFNRTVPSGVTSRVHHYRSWGKNCEGNGGMVKLLTKPQHGKLTTRTVDSRIEINRFARDGKTECTGRPIKAFEVNYRSDPGFRGTDTFTIEMVTGRGSRDVDNYTVNVQ